MSSFDVCNWPRSAKLSHHHRIRLTTDPDLDVPIVHHLKAHHS
jgi:hypothetical protein